MDCSSDEDANLSALEFDEYRSRCYDRLQSGKYRLRNPDESLRCPFCPLKKKQEYGQRDLMRHAYGVGRGSRRRSLKQRAKHCALHDFIETCLAKHSDPSNWPQQPILVVNESIQKEDLYCWPWTGIVATAGNDVISKNTSASTSSGYWSEVLSKYKPVNVETFYDDLKRITQTVVEFERDWIGFKNAVEFERAYVSDGHSRKEWSEGQKLSSLDMYGWIVRADDYHSEGPVGEYIRKKGQLKSLHDIVIEEKQGKDCVAKVNLASEIKMKCVHLDTFLFKLNENSICFNQMLEEMDQLHQKFMEAMPVKYLDEVTTHHEGLITTNTTTLQQHSTLLAKNKKTMKQILSKLANAEKQTLPLQLDPRQQHQLAQLQQPQIQG